MTQLDYNATVLLDSVAPNGHRLTTFQVTFPRFVLAEFNTHRRLSRNAASSRAIPVSKCVEMVQNSPVVPIEWGVNRSGMQASETLDAETAISAENIWLCARDSAVYYANTLQKINVHKQLANRIIEPFRWVTVITSGTEWSNFFGLRCHPDAQPEIHHAADLMRDEFLSFLEIDEPSFELIKAAHLMQAAYEESKPQYLDVGMWHMPMLREDDWTQFHDNVNALKMLSVARCARVSYLTHDGRRDVQKDIDLHDALALNRHWSPFEHVARALSSNAESGNFIGWHQYRKDFEDEEM